MAQPAPSTSTSSKPPKTSTKLSLSFRRKLSDLPAKFMQESLEGDLSPQTITSPPLQYAPEVDRFVSGEERERLLVDQENEDALFSEAKRELRQLREAVQVYRHKSSRHKDSTAATNSVALLDKNDSWSVVKEEIALAIREQGSDDESQTAKGWCNKIVTNLPVFETWLELLPDGDYGAVVCGVFKLVVNAAKRANEVRVTIYNALADIPDWIANAGRYRALYEEKRPRALRQKTAQLCSIVLISLRHVLEYLAEGRFKSALKTIGQGSTYKQNLLAALKAGRDAAAAIDLEAGILMQYRLKDLEDGQEKLLELGRELSRKQEALPQELMESVAKVAVNNILSHLLSNSSVISPDGSWLLRSQSPIPFIEAAEAKEQVIDRDRLCAVIGYSPDAAFEDLEHCLNQGRLLDVPEQDRVKWMANSRHVREWLHHPTSRVLLINGNNSGDETCSPTTFLTARLSATLQNIGSIITLSFFCSMHTTSKDDIEGDAAGLVRSLIAQLLSRGIQWDLSFLTQEDIEKLEEDDFDALCSLFRGLVGQLAKKTLMFWMIDGITLYERSSWRERFLKVVSELLDIMDDSSHVVIKLLMSCHGRSAFVKNYVKDEDTLLVPSSVDGDSQGWSEQTWIRERQGDVEELEDSVLDSEG